MLTAILTLCSATKSLAQYTFTNEEDLRAAVNNSGLTGTIVLDNDIELTNRLNVGYDADLGSDLNHVTIDLNGHTLRRLMDAADDGGQVISVFGGWTLTIKDSSGDNSGKITGGWSYQGGAIYVYPDAQLTIEGGTITGNRADTKGGGYGYGGGVENHGTMTITGGKITGNTAGQFGGGIHNEGTLTITGGTITDNTAGTYGGAIYSNSTVSISGATLSGNTAQSGGGAICTEGTLTLDGVTISGNSAQNGGGIYMFGTGTVQLKGESSITGNTAQAGGGIFQVTNGNAEGPTLKMQDKPVVQDNTTDNVHLQSYQLITVTGAFSEGARIGVSTEVEQSAFTAGYSTYNPGVAPSIYFFVSSAVIAGDVVLSGNEASIQQTGYAYVERGWDAANNKVTETIKTCTSFAPINGNDTSDEGGWIPLYDGWYVVTGNSTYKALSVLGTDVKLILPDGVTLYVNHVKLESGHKLTIYGQSTNTGTLDAINDEFTNAAGIGGGEEANAGLIIIHGGTINATGNKNAAGIGGGYKGAFAHELINGGLTVYGGQVTAKGSSRGEGAGIGSGGACEFFAGYVTIYGGTVNATGSGNTNPDNSCSGAGIGGGNGSPGAITYIYGGTVNADAGIGNTGREGASIGGGREGDGQHVYIYGGNVTAKGGNGAAIGGGKGGSGGDITIEGGIVNATCDKKGAAIGCGTEAGRATITITGGTVTADGGSEGVGIGRGYSISVPPLYITISGGTVTAKGYHGIGASYGVNSFEHHYRGTLNITGGKVYATGRKRAIGGENIAGLMTLYDGAMVKAGDTADEAVIFSAGERVPACVYRKYAAIEPCTHNGATYTVSGTASTDTHTKHCAYCSTEFEPETHTFIDGKCTVCGVEHSTYIVTVYVPANNGATDGVYETVTYQMVPGTKFKLPASPITFSDQVFAGWLVGTAKNSSYTTRYGEELLSAGDEYTINGDVAFTARYSYIYVTLADNADNSETLSKYAGKTAIQVLLRDRTLYKDGRWNTLCLPFALSDFTGTPLEGATVKTLTTTAFADGTLTLNFSEDLTAIEAGKPYIVKWKNAESTEIVSPVFKGGTISNATTDMETNEVTFSGIFSPYAIEGEDRTMLYLGGDNKLYYPNGAMTIGACRAYFKLADGLTAGEPTTAGAQGVKAFVLNFDDEATSGIRSLTPNPSPKGEGSDCWYTLDGRRLTGKPTQKGIYINNGNKVVIK